MIFGPILKLRDKITRKRQQLTQDEEKPFLDHLEDLRNTIMRIIATLMIAVIACFLFNEKFFKLMEQPLRSAGLDQPKEFNIPKSVVAVSEEGPEQQAAWWRIHGTARGIADLDGPLRESFLKVSAPDDFTRRFGWALLLYHAADSLPEKDRAGWIASAAATLPEAADRDKVVAYTAELVEAKTSRSLEKPRNALEMETFAPPEGFMLSMKLSLFAGIIISFPLLFYFLLEFILPGLTGRERKMIFPAMGIGFALFLAGVAFAWFVVVPQTLKYFSDYNHDLGVLNNWRVGYYQSFVTSFTLIFGLVFETPVVIMIMVKLGLLTSRFMRNSRGWAVIIILVAAAVITPTGDMLSMSLMAAPMIIMFEACIWLAWLHERKEAKREREEQRQDQARRAALVGVASVEASRPDGEQSALPEHSETMAEHEGSHHVNPPDHSDDSVIVPSVETHPHHPEPSGSHDDDYEQYLRDHAGHRPEVETHTETVPVEQRHDPVAEPPAPEAPPAPVTPPASDEVTGPEVPPKDSDSKPGGYTVS
jgi:sec-independent protein translocase protein TatC